MNIKNLIGSGDKIGVFMLPFIITGLVLNYLFPEFFRTGGPSDTLIIISILMLIPGVVIWLWSVILILTMVPKKELITNGPFALVKHPLYTGVSLLVLPSIGFLLNTWLGAAIGIIMYIVSRKYSVEEDKYLSKTFGAKWNQYAGSVMIPWM
jgi:protein-S-isoprenylcysteine O-methyltransferase Ste14